MIFENFGAEAHTIVLSALVRVSVVLRPETLSLSIISIIIIRVGVIGMYIKVASEPSGNLGTDFGTGVGRSSFTSFAHGSGIHIQTHIILFHIRTLVFKNISPSFLLFVPIIDNVTHDASFNVLIIADGTFSGTDIVGIVLCSIIHLC
ncbi:hypothetical protein CF326_g9274 [Tilletia indica]|nr:hypothetical protein CF326_g9274 [Tilletia indica]